MYFLFLFVQLLYAFFIFYFEVRVGVREGGDNVLTIRHHPQRCPCGHRGHRGHHGQSNSIQLHTHRGQSYSVLVPFRDPRNSD